MTVAVRGFLRVGELRRYARLDRSSLWVALTALVGVLLFDLLPGLLLAVALSLLLFIAAAGRRDVAVLGRLPGTRLYGDITEHPGARTAPGVLVVRPDGSLFFGNISRVRLAVRDQVRAADPPPHTVVLDLAGSHHLGVPVLDTLDELRDELHRHGIALRLAHVRSRAAADLDRHPLAARLGPHARHRTVADAVTAADPAGGPGAG
ncbi:STAS domain-containing protein [Streptomyces sp. NPDC090994]|uniref:STAS domain-containing protein n=1 Tax=Streptomyces sp. NPDC090994 TaxID=3365969 RepID=UPI0037F59378